MRNLVPLMDFLMHYSPESDKIHSLEKALE
jgi:hypothetical protein